MRLEAGCYFGHVKSAELEGYSVGLSFHQSHDHLPKHHHEYPYWSFPLQGSYLEKVSGTEALIDNRQVLFRPAGYEHQNEFGRIPGVCFNIEIKNPKVSDKPNVLETPRRMQLSLNATQVLAAYLNQAPKDELECLVEEFLSEWNGRSNIASAPKKVRKVKDYVRENYQRKISLAEIAQLLDVSKHYLARLFRKSTGQTIGSYIREVRLAHAYIAVLQDREANLTHLALRHGFYDQAHFIRNFNEFYRKAPLHHRKKFKEVNPVQF